MRSKSTRRKEFKTEEKELFNGIKYLIWGKAPSNLKKVTSKDLGKRLWIAGTSSSDIWRLKQFFNPGDKFYPDGGVEVENKKGEVICLFLDEVIIHPKQK